MKRFAWYAALVFTVLLVVFVVQNAAEIRLRFLFWSVATQSSLVVAALLAIGFAFGWAVRGAFRRRLARKAGGGIAPGPSVGPGQ